MLQPILRVFKTSFIDPLAEFIHDSRAIGIVLICSTIISLILANVTGGYTALWNAEIPFFHSLHLPHTLLHFINDGLMTIFFFLAGLEIRREMREGELASIRQSILPVVAAAGGMLIPALIYFAFNAETEYSRGWAIPTATDIAFSLGIASLLGKRVPFSVKVFLTALAIIDDLGAITVIALFYGSDISLSSLTAAALTSVVIFFYSRYINKINLLVVLGGILLWYCMFNSGIHATIAGVLFAFVIPSHKLNALQLKLHHTVNFVIMPLFAFANTAILFPDNIGAALSTGLAWGVMLGLLLGKPIGIFLATFALVKTKLAPLPTDASLKQLLGAGMLAGIGFTMSIFISVLAFDSNNQDIAKIAVLLASTASGIFGYFWLKAASKKRMQPK